MEIFTTEFKLALLEAAKELCVANEGRTTREQLVTKLGFPGCPEIIGTALSLGCLPGFELRKGRYGGLHMKSEKPAVNTPVKDAAITTEEPVVNKIDARVEEGPERNIDARVIALRMIPLSKPAMDPDRHKIDPASGLPKWLMTVA